MKKNPQGRPKKALKDQVIVCSAEADLLDDCIGLLIV